MKVKHTVTGMGILVVLIAAATVAAASGPSGRMPEEKLERLLDQVEKNFSRIRTLKTRLVQEKQIPVFTQRVISRGVCLFERPDRLRLEYTEPFQSVLIVNGSSVTKYEFFDGQWQKLTPGGQDVLLMITDHISSWLKGRFRDRQRYEISAVEDATITIRLVPKADTFKRFVQSFELGLNQTLDGLEYIVIHENQDAFTRIRFFKEVKNHAIPDAVFDGGRPTPVRAPAW